MIRLLHNVKNDDFHEILLRSLLIIIVPKVPEGT